MTVIRKLAAMCVAVVAFFLPAMNAAAQGSPTLRQFIFTPRAPQSGDNVSVFLHSSAPGSALVMCGFSALSITRVQVIGNDILLDLPAALPASFTIEPYCVGNTVPLGVLAAGSYTVTARIVSPSGAVASPAFLTTQLLVGNGAPLAVPVWDTSIMLSCILGLLLLGGRALKHARD